MTPEGEDLFFLFSALMSVLPFPTSCSLHQAASVSLRNQVHQAQAIT